jgi:hypothetical protein
MFGFLKQYTALLLLVCSGAAYAQDTTVSQYTAFDAKRWHGLTENSKTYVVLGYVTGYQAGRDDWTQCVPKKLYRSPLLSVGEWIAGIERFYANPKNALIEFPNVMIWVRFKAEGSTAEELDRLETELRGEANIGSGARR